MGDDQTKDTRHRNKESAAARQDRLAAALRQNLTRRKAQGRARKTPQENRQDESGNGNH